MAEPETRYRIILPDGKVFGTYDSLSGAKSARGHHRSYLERRLALCERGGNVELAQDLKGRLENLETELKIQVAYLSPWTDA